MKCIHFARWACMYAHVHVSRVYQRQTVPDWPSLGHHTPLPPKHLSSTLHPCFLSQWNKDADYLQKGDRDQQRGANWKRWPTVRRFETAIFMSRRNNLIRLTTTGPNKTHLLESNINGDAEFEWISKDMILFFFILTSQSTAKSVVKS